MTYVSGNISGLPLVDFSRIEAVLADFDDTLVDYRNPCRAGLEMVRSSIPEFSGVDINVMETEYREVLRENLPALFDGTITVEEEISTRMQEILRRHGKQTGNAEIGEYVSLFHEGFWKSRTMMEGAAEFLELCRRHDLPVIVVTNGNLEMQKRSVDMLGLNGLIEAILTPEDSSEMKPDTAMFEKALEISGAGKEDTVMIGDTWQHDIVGAIRSGIRPVWINSRKIQRPDEYAVTEISSLRELTDGFPLR